MEVSGEEKKPYNHIPMDSALVSTAFPEYISEKRNSGWIEVIMSESSLNKYIVNGSYASAQV